MINSLQVIRRFVFAEWGGTETVVWNTSRELKNLGAEVKILATAALDKIGPENVEGIEIQRFPYFYPYLNMNKNKKLVLDKKGGDPYSLSLYKYMMQSPHIDIIHCHTMNRIAAQVRSAARKKKIPYLVSFHGGHFAVPEDEIKLMVAPYKGSFNYGRIIDALIGKKHYLDDADGIICVGFEEYEIAKEKYPSKKVLYLPNGVDPHKFELSEENDFRKKFNIEPDCRMILCVSRLDYQKNQKMLVALTKLLKNRGEKVKLVLIGPVTSDIYYRSILQQAKDENVEDNLIIIGGLRQDDKNLVKAFRTADLFILPSIHEPFGIVVLEAWASQLPVIAAARGGLKKLITHNENGLLFDGSLDDLYHKYKIITEDEDLKQKFTSAALDEVHRNYTWKVITNRLVNFYEEVITSCKGRNK